MLDAVDDEAMLDAIAKRVQEVSLLDQKARKQALDKIKRAQDVQKRRNDTQRSIGILPPLQIGQRVMV